MVDKKTKKKEDVAGKKDSDIISDKERVDKGQVLARVLIEVLGAPKDYVEEAIQLVVDKARQIDNAELISESTYEAEEKDKLFITFSELEIWFKDMDQILKFMFEFTPSSIEIIQPTKMVVTSQVMSGVCNDFLLKMHDLGLKLKDMSAKSQLLQNNADALVRNLFKIALIEPRTLAQMSELTGIPKENAKAILENFENAGIVGRKGNTYEFLKK